MNVTQESLQEMFEYKDGALYSKNTNTRVGGRHHTGYWYLTINRKQYNAHRLIFLMHHGYLPPIIDHIDGDRGNDRIENLRPATHRQNLQNMKLRPTNKSGFKNVSWVSDRKKWLVQLSINGKQTNIGRFDDLEFANLVATEAREKFHGAFARHF